MDYIYQYLLFLAQAVTIVVAVLVILANLAAAAMRRVPNESGHLEVRKLNDRLRDLRYVIEDHVVAEPALKAQRKQEAKADKQDQSAAKKAVKAAKGAQSEDDSKDEGAEPPRTFVLDFEGDVQASRVRALRAEITAVLTLAGPKDEVVVRLESPGGMVPHYGLAASQLHRIIKAEVPLLVAVDKIAASGGYLMAAVASRIIAAPFALVGSIGVVAQVPNVHRLLKKNDVDVDVLTAGKYKRTLTMLGENTEEGRQKFIEELEETHDLFQGFVKEHRPTVDLEQVATGEAWYGQRAIDLSLVDEILTSDEYLSQACGTRDVFEVRWVEQKKPLDRLIGQAGAAFESALQNLTRYWTR